MSQHDLDLANAAGATFRSDLNSALVALGTLQSGATAPATTYAYMLWADTTSGLLKQRNAANSGWLVRSTLAESFVVSRSSNTILAGADLGKTIIATAGFTQTLTAAATLGDGWYVDYNAGGFSVVLDPNSTETIDGSTTKTVTGSGRIYCNGSAFFTIGFASVTQTIVRGGFTGFQMSAPGSSGTMTVQPGQCADSTNAAYITLASAMAKTTGAFSAGTGNGGLDTGTIANNTTYHFYAIDTAAGGSADITFSTSASTPTLSGSYVGGKYQWIGFAKTNGSAQWPAQLQDGNRVRLYTPVLEVSAVSFTTTYATTALTAVPTGKRVRAFGKYNGGTGGSIMNIRPVGASDGNPLATATPLGLGGSNASNHLGAWNEITDTSAQISIGGNTTVSSYLTCEGWEYLR